MNQRSSLPQRTDSLGKTPAFSQIEEELRDIRRVHAQGQEEDLRMALSRTIGRVEELVCLYGFAASTRNLQESYCSHQC